MLKIVRIAGRAFVRVLSREVVGEFAYIDRAHQNTASGLQTRNDGCVFFRRWAVAIDLGARARRQPFDVEQVLDGERRAGKRPEALSARAGGVDGVGFGQRASPSRQ